MKRPVTAVWFVFLLLAAAFALGCTSRRGDYPQPSVTAKGSAGDEDVPDLTLPRVTLKPGDTLLVSCDDEGGDVALYWKDLPLHRDAGTHGSGFYTTIYSLYTATGGTGDIFASHVSAGDLTINAYAVTHLAPAAPDQTAAAQGRGTTPASGVTPATSHANEFLWGAIGYATSSHASGTWSGGFTPGAQFTNTGGIGGVEDGYKTVSSTGAYAAAKSGTNNDAWIAVIATYATAAGK